MKSHFGLNRTEGRSRQRKWTVGRTRRLIRLPSVPFRRTVPPLSRSRGSGVPEGARSREGKVRRTPFLHSPLGRLGPPPRASYTLGSVSTPRTPLPTSTFHTFGPGRFGHLSLTRVSDPRFHPRPRNEQTGTSPVSSDSTRRDLRPRDRGSSDRHFTRTPVIPVSGPVSYGGRPDSSGTT